MMTSFRYLGRVISAEDDDWTVVVQNLEMARAVWRSMTRVLSREGADPRVSGFFFKSVVRSVIIFRAETWVGNLRMCRVLEGFQDQVARRLKGRLPPRREDRKWDYTLVEAEGVDVGFEAMEEYIP